MKSFFDSNTKAEGACPLPVRIGLSILTLGAGLVLSTPTFAAAPPAGSIISNQATATYTDASSESRTATSNVVETQVEQVGSLTLDSDNAKEAALGNTVYMPHTLTNTGNFTDTFTLNVDPTTAGGTFTLGTISIYADANKDGLPDSTDALCTTAITGASGATNTCGTISLPAGGVYTFVTALTVPSTGPTAAQLDKVTVTATAATSGKYTSPTATDIDTVTITDQAAFQVIKSISQDRGTNSQAGLVYTLTYKNIGGAVGNLTLKDTIGDVANKTDGFTYVGAAHWGNMAAVTLDEANSSTTIDTSTSVTDPLGVTRVSEVRYATSVSGVVTTIAATISKVGPNVTGTITFVVNVNPLKATVGTATTTNTARSLSVLTFI